MPEVKKFEITIDCPPPSNGRQQTYFNNIMLKLKEDKNPEIRRWVEENIKAETVSRSFGEWTWNLPFLPKYSQYIKNFFMEEFKAIYNSGGLRYASFY